MNRNVKILSRILYLQSLKNVSWIEDAQLFFLIFHTFVYNFFSPAAPSILPNLQTNVWKIRNKNTRVLAARNPLNLVNTIFCSVF